MSSRELFQKAVTILAEGETAETFVLAEQRLREKLGNDEYHRLRAIGLRELLSVLDVGDVFDMIKAGDK